MTRQKFAPADSVLAPAEASNQSDDRSVTSDNLTNPTARKSPLATRSSACSDYFSDSGSRTRAAASPPDPDTVDFSEEWPTSPLLDFGRKEREYISKVIQIACQRTSLLRKSKFSSTQSGISY